MRLNCCLRSGRPVASRTNSGVVRLAALLWLAAVPVAFLAPAFAAAADSAVPNDDFEEGPEPFVPAKARTEADLDRIRGTALFAAGRTSEQRQDFPAALRYYERSLRFDPGAPAVLREIVALAFNLDRRAEAARYARLIAGSDPDDGVLLRRLGLELAEEGDWEGALRLYEKVATLNPDEKPAATSVLWWMETGRLYYLTKQYAAAAKEFSRVQQALERPAEYGLNETMRKAILGSSELTYQLFGECFLESGQTAAARAAFEKSNAEKANAGLLAYNLARVEARDKQTAAALEKLQTYFDQHLTAQATSPYQLLAELLKESGQGAELLARLEKLHTADPGNVPLTYYLAEQYRAAGQADKAEPLYRKLAAGSAKRPPVEAYEGLIDLLHTAGRWEDLSTVLGEALGKTGGFEPLESAGKRLLADKPAVDQLLAIAQKNTTIEAAKGQYGSWLAAALLACERQQYDAANDYFALALAAAPQKAAELTLTWGLELLAANQYAAAAKVFQRGLDAGLLPAQEPAFYFYLAGALEMSGDTESALAAARKASELQADSPRFLSRLGWIQYHAHRTPEARAAYTDLIKKFDGNHESAEVRDVMHDARLVLSNLDVTQGAMPEAEEWLQQVLDEFPSDAGALNDLGYIWCDQGKHLETSLQMILQAVAVEPKNMAYRDSLGWAYYRLGRFAEAVAELKTAAGVESPDATVLDHLGDALWAGGDQAAAVATWTKALAAFDRETEQKKIDETQQKINRAPPAK